MAQLRPGISLTLAIIIIANFSPHAKINPGEF